MRSSLSKQITESKEIRPQQGPESRLATLAPEITEDALSPYLEDRDLASLSNSSFTLHSMTRRKLTFIKLLNAMLHDDPSTVSQILRDHPDLLFIKLEDYHIAKIQSHYTWLQYLTKGETVFSIAQKLNLVNMVEIMFPYFLDALKKAQASDEKTHAIEELGKQFIMTEPTSEEQKALQERYIQNHLSAVIAAFLADTTIRVDARQIPGTSRYQTIIHQVSMEIADAVQNLRDELFKPKFIKDCIDMKQLLIAALKAHNDNFHMQASQQREAFSILVIGFIQSLQDPQLGKILCEGLGFDRVADLPQCNPYYAAGFMMQSLKQYIQEQLYTVSFLRFKCDRLLAESHKVEVTEKEENTPNINTQQPPATEMVGCGAKLSSGRPQLWSHNLPQNSSLEEQNNKVRSNRIFYRS